MVNEEGYAVVGVDQSLSHTAWWMRFGDGSLRSGSIRSKPEDFDHSYDRLRWIRREWREVLQWAPRGSWVFTEGYAFGAKRGREALGELGGMLRIEALDQGMKVIAVSPPTLKAFVCSGGAKKELMLQQTLKTWGYEATDNNDCDAYCLMKVGEAFLSLENQTKKSQKLLGKLEVWR